MERGTRWLRDFGSSLYDCMEINRNRALRFYILTPAGAAGVVWCGRWVQGTFFYIYEGKSQKLWWVGALCVARVAGGVRADHITCRLREGMAPQ